MAAVVASSRSSSSVRPLGLAVGAFLGGAAVATAVARWVAGRRRSVDVLPPASVGLLEQRLSECSVSLSTAREEVAGLLALLRTKEERLGEVERERLDHAEALYAVFPQAHDLRGIRMSVDTLHARIAELEQQLADAQNGTVQATWPHVYPLAWPASTLPVAIRAAALTHTAVLWDLDGTLVESKDIWYKLLDALSRHLGYGGIAYDVWLPTYGQSMEENRRLWYPVSTQAEVDEFCDEHYVDFVDHLKILPGAVAALTAARDFLGSTDRMVICTNCPTKITQVIVRSVPELSEFFTPDRIVCAGARVHLDKTTKSGGHIVALDYDFTAEERRQYDASSTGLDSYQLKPKPAVDIIVRACEVALAQAHEAVFVGDSKFDLIASMTAECFAIGIGPKGRGGNMWIDTIQELPKKLVR